MKRSAKFILMPVLLLALVSLLAACANARAANSPSSQAANTVDSSAQFAASSLAINPPEVNAGVQALITAQITNLSESDQKYDGRIRIDRLNDVTALPGLVAPPLVTIPAKSTKLMSANVTMNYPGTYRISWEGASAEMVVNPQDASAPQGPPPGGYGAAPDFKGVDVVTGKALTLRQFQGRAVLLNFVNYGCDPNLNNKVSEQLLAIQKLSQQRSDFIPVSVFCGCCPPDVLRQFAKQNNFNWPWILDTDYSIAPKYGQYLKKYGYPTLVFIDANQNIVDVSGYADLASLTDKLNQAAVITGKIS